MTTRVTVDWDAQYMAVLSREECGSIEASCWNGNVDMYNTHFCIVYRIRDIIV